MNEISKPAQSDRDHRHTNGGSCCGGGSADTEAEPQTAPVDKATEAQKSDTKTKPAGSSGCCR